MSRAHVAVEKRVPGEKTLIIERVAGDRDAVWDVFHLIAVQTHSKFSRLFPARRERASVSALALVSSMLF